MKPSYNAYIMGSESSLHGSKDLELRNEYRAQHGMKGGRGEFSR